MKGTLSLWLLAETKTYPHRWFFPAASIYALLMVPLAMLARHGYGPTALAMPTGHAFEMLFGFILALIAGYLLGPIPRRRVVLFMLFWILARVTGLISSASEFSLILNAVFAFLLAHQLLPKLWVAKKWRNRTLVPLLALICVMTVIIALTQELDRYALQRYLLRESVQLFALLMLFMAGRMLAPAAAGEFYRQGMELEARVQPNIEAGLIITMTGAVSLTPILPSIAGILLITCGTLAAIRLIRWQLWHCLARPDLICLGVGYAWLATGLILLGWAKLNSSEHFSSAIHAITVGALGTLATNVMVRVTLLHAKQYPSRIPQIVTFTAIMNVAAIARIAADWSVVNRELLLALAATSWSISLLIVTVILLQHVTKNDTAMLRKSIP